MAYIVCDSQTGENEVVDQVEEAEKDEATKEYEEELIQSNWNEVCEHFDDMELKDELLRGVYGYGFERPSAIQQRAIKPIILERDVIAQAQSG